MPNIKNIKQALELRKEKELAKYLDFKGRLYAPKRNIYALFGANIAIMAKNYKYDDPESSSHTVFSPNSCSTSKIKESAEETLISGFV